MLRNYFIRTGKATLLYKLAQVSYYQLLCLGNIKNMLLVKTRLRKKLATMRDKKIQFGAGSSVGREAVKTQLHDFVDTDLLGDLPVDITKKLPLDSGSVEIIFSCHLIEHVYEYEIFRFIEECHRILSSSGTLITATPDLEKICLELYSNSENLRKQHFVRHHASLLGKKPTAARILNSIMHLSYGHKFLLDFETFNEISRSAGFKKVYRSEVDLIEDRSVREFITKRSKNFLNETAIWIAKK